MIQRRLLTRESGVDAAPCGERKGWGREPCVAAIVAGEKS